MYDFTVENFRFLEVKAQAVKLQITVFRSGQVGSILVCVAKSLKQLRALVCFLHVLSAKEALTRLTAVSDRPTLSKIMLWFDSACEYLASAVGLASLVPVEIQFMHGLPNNKVVQ
jgi:hypothetical protein